MTTETLDPRTVVVLGLGEAGSALARGLAADSGWLTGNARRLVAVDIALGQGARGEGMAALADRLGIAAHADYGPWLDEADLVMSVVTGEQSLDAARSMAAHLRPGTLYLDLNTVTRAMALDNAAVVEATGARYVDVAVMGTFLGLGHRVPMLLAGPDAENVAAWMTPLGFQPKVLGPVPGSASAVKILRSVLVKGIEALGVECLVAARAQGLQEEVLACLADIDLQPFRDFLATLVTTHLVHAGRRHEEMHLAARNLVETGVEPLMTERTAATLGRTVAAGVAPADGKVPPLDAVLDILAAGVPGLGAAREPMPRER